MKVFLFTASLLLAADVSVHCCSGAIDGTGEPITDPTLMLTFKPPTSWTFYSSEAATNVANLPGQSANAVSAKNAATGALTAAVTEGLNAANIPLSGITITPEFEPKKVDGCSQTKPTPAATVFFKVVDGVVSDQVTAVDEITAEGCLAQNFGTATLVAFEQEATVEIKGLSVTESQLKNIINKMSATLSTTYRVKLTSEITDS